MPREWKHNELAEDLAGIKNTPYLDIPLGSIVLGLMAKWNRDPPKGEIPGVQRADVMEIKPSYTRFCISIYEIKISRQDFQNDIRSGKWRGYLDHCQRFYFAVASGVAKKEDVPPEAGLIIRGETGWSTVRAAPVREVDVPQHTLMSLIFMKQRKGHSTQHRDHLLKLHRWNCSGEDFYKSLGKKLGNALRNYDEYKLAKGNFEYWRDEITLAVKEGLGQECYWPLGDLRKLVTKIKEKAGEVV